MLGVRSVWTVVWAGVWAAACKGEAGPAGVDAGPGEVGVADEGLEASVDGAALDSPEPTGCAVCAVWGEVGRGPPVQGDHLVEISGIAESRRRPGLYWVHNDSGDRARVFALDAEGRTRAEVALEGAAGVDLEDLAVGPCGASTCVFVGDVGDNNRRRTDCAVLRFDEAVLDRLEADPSVTARLSVRPMAMPLRYPDGPRDAEALVVDPGTGRFGIISKEPTGPSGVYLQPSEAGSDGVFVLERAGSLTVPAGAVSLVTGADWHPCAPRIVVRTYDRVLEYVGAPGDGLGAIAGGVPTVLASAREIQGESVGWSVDGRGYFTISEGRAQPLRLTRCVQTTGRR